MSLASARGVPAFPDRGPLLPWLAQLEGQRLDDVLSQLALEDVAEIERERFDWRLFARVEQLPPPGDWRIWGLQAGRGGGKTASGAHWVVRLAEELPGCRVGLVGPTAAKVRDLMVEGESGIMSVCPPHLRPRYEPSKKRITFAGESRCSIYSADEPDQSRGANLHFGWADEVGEWDDPEAWTNLDMALRKARDGMRPRICVSTTPRPTCLIRDIFQGPMDATGRRQRVRWSVLRPAIGTLPPAYIAQPSGDTVVTRWSTEANRANLSGDYLRRMRERYAGTRLGRQELDAEILEDTPGALWKLQMLDACRVQRSQVQRLERIVVACDPSHGDGGGDACGIVVVGVSDKQGFVMADRTISGSPFEWGGRLVEVYHEFRADLVVYESNQTPGKPDVVPDTIRTIVESGIRCLGIHASRDKRTRADPVASLYEQGRVHHVTDPASPDHLALLEDEMTSWDPTSRQSPNRLDALVHGVSYLMLQAPALPAVAPVSLGTRPSPWRT